MCISAEQQHEKEKVWTDVDEEEDETSETSETPKKVINKSHTTAGYGIWMLGRKWSPTHTSASLYSAEIRGQHRCIPGEIDTLAEAHIHVAEDGLALHVAFPSLLRACYEP